MSSQLSMSLPSRWLATAALIVIAAAPLGAGAQERTPERRVPSSANELRLSYAPVVRRAAPAVVNVYAAKTVAVRNPLFADPDALEVGDVVLAIGNPFAVGQTVTHGIVSALARTEVGITDYQFFIQTDAAINPGNSGGALVDLSGRLVGINTAIFSRTGGSQGIGFAIPAN